MFLLTESSKAQENNKEFNTITFGVDVLKDFTTDGFQQNWEPQIGGEGYFRTPFYFGNLQTGIVYCAYGSLKNGNPDFKVFSFYLQWEYEVRLLPIVSFSIGGRTGLTEMKFAENNIVTDANLLSESELTIGLISRLSLLLPKGWQINISGNYLTIFTYPRMNTTFISGGISKSFTTPEWLRDFLK